MAGPIRDTWGREGIEDWNSARNVVYGAPHSIRAAVRGGLVSELGLHKHTRSPA